MAAFAAHAAVTGTWGPRVVALRDNANLTDRSIGLALTALAIGLLVGTRLAGPADARLGTRRVIRVGAPLTSLTLIPPAFAHGFASLAAALFLAGVGSGLLDVANNEYAVVVERASGRPLMGGIHGVWSASLLVSSGVSAAAAALGVAVAAQFTVVAVVLAIATALAFHELIDPGPSAQVPFPVAAAPVRRAGRLLAAICFAAFFCEGASADWSSVYVRDVSGAAAGVAAAGFVALATGETACRVFVDRLSARHGPVRIVRVGAAGVVLALGTALLEPDPGVVLPAFFLLGVSLAPIVPIAFSAAGNTPGRSSGTALRFAVTVGYVGSIAGPAAIGLAAGEVGLRTALAIPLALAVAVYGLAGATAAAPGGGRR
jgi:MFS family permease